MYNCKMCPEHTDEYIVFCKQYISQQATVPQCKHVAHIVDMHES